MRPKMTTALSDLAAAKERIAELEDERNIFKRTLDIRDTRVAYLESESAHNALVAQNRYERIAELEDERNIFKRTLDIRDERIAELEEVMAAWLQYEEDTSDCPNCMGCKDSAPDDLCIFKAAARLMADRPGARAISVEQT